MTDRELLERAAKAYWGNEIDDVVSVEWSQADQAIVYIHGDNQDHNGNDVPYVWNPLEDDGDALRLAVRLRIQPQFQPQDRVFTGYYNDNHPTRPSHCPIIEKLGGDPCAATRRAITRAAAEMAPS